MNMDSLSRGGIGRHLANLYSEIHISCNFFLFVSLLERGGVCIIDSTLRGFFLAILSTPEKFIAGYCR